MKVGASGGLRNVPVISGRVLPTVGEIGEVGGGPYKGG